LQAQLDEHFAQALAAGLGDGDGLVDLVLGNDTPADQNLTEFLA
jgi:hypothetical protein